MIELIRQNLNGVMPHEEKVNRAREVLQIAALKIMYEKELHNRLAFVGGTALRVLYDLRRFSEDLDFSLIDPAGYDFRDFLNGVVAGFKQYGLPAEAKPKTERTVHSAMLKFKGLLKDLGLSPMADQNLSIKIEVDSAPPAGWRLENTIVNKLFMFAAQHFDLQSMFATKLHACFYRKFTKGRDFYDFMWYISKKTKPNFVILNNAIMQTQGSNPGIDENNFADFLLKHVRKIDFKAARKDVEPFLEDKSELELFDLKVIESTIGKNVERG